MKEKLKLLLIDDGDVVRVLMSELFSELPNVQVVGTASDGDEALRKIEALAPDIVTLDMRMPGKNGIELIPLIRALDNPPEIVVLTNYPFSAYRRRCRELGVEHFFDKTSELHKAVAVVKQRVYELLEHRVFAPDSQDSGFEVEDPSPQEGSP